MTCDEFFETLTSTGCCTTGDAHQHLLNCPRCRDLQEAIFPALNMLQSTPATACSRPLFDPALIEPQQQAPPPVAPSPHVDAAKYTQSGWRYVVAFAAGVAASFGLAAGLRSEPSLTPLSSAVCLWNQRDTTSNDAAANKVVLSCVACHLSPPATSLPQ